MKLRLLVVILTAAALFSGVVLWRVDRFVYGDRMAWAEAQARSQISSMIQAIKVEIQSARRSLSTVNADTFKADRTNWRGFQPYYAVALMTSQNGAMAITQMTTKPDSPAAGWTTVQLGQYLGFLGKELESRGTVILRSFKDAKKNPHVAVIFAGGGHAYILVGSGGNFQSLIDSQKGSINSFSIVASDGLTISHAIPEYIGTVMSDSTLFKEIRSTGSAQGLGSYMQGKRQVFGMYEQVPNSSAYVISIVPIDELVKGRLSLTWQFVFLAIGFGLVGAAAYFWYEKRNGGLVTATADAAPVIASPARAQEVLPPIPSVSMQNVISPPPAPAVTPKKLGDVVTTKLGDVVTTNSVLVAPTAPKTAPPSTGTYAQKGMDSVPAPVVPPDWQQEKAEAYRQVAAAMGQEMRAPLASILGFSQMVLSKTQDPDVVQAVESILREARSSRDVLEKLVTFSGERSAPKAAAKIEGPVMQALKKLEPRMTEKGVKVEKDFQETQPWVMASDDLVKVFENIFENSIEAMERMQEKTIKVSTWESGQGLHIRIVDTGEGIDRENLGKVFEPFFTTRSYANHVGLGLPVSAGILKEHQAQMKIQSQRGQGTQVDIVLPMVEAQTKIATAEFNESAKALNAHELPAELPRAVAASEEEVAVAMKDTEHEPEKLTDINVDNLLELPPEEIPLQFLDGMGFDDPPPSAPLPKIQPLTPTPPPRPAAPPPPVLAAAVNAEPPSPPPPPPAPPDEIDLDPSAQDEVPMEDRTVVRPANEPVVIPLPPKPSVVIDKPVIDGGAQKTSELDSYKVEVKRPGKRT